MSDQFELLQEIDQCAFADPQVNSIFHVEVQRDRSRVHNRANWADEDALRLVQQIFIVSTPPQIVMFSGIDHGTGCTGLCVSVAETLARNTRRPVCLMEANFRSPGLSDLIGTTDRQGLTDALPNKGQIESFAKPFRQDNLWLLPSGSISPDSPSLLSFANLHDRMIELREAFDFVIIDAPPLNLYLDAIAIGQASDGLVMILNSPW